MNFETAEKVQLGDLVTYGGVPKLVVVVRENENGALEFLTVPESEAIWAPKSDFRGNSPVGTVVSSADGHRKILRAIKGDMVLLTSEEAGTWTSYHNVEQGG